MEMSNLRDNRLSFGAERCESGNFMIATHENEKWSHDVYGSCLCVALRFVYAHVQLIHIPNDESLCSPRNVFRTWKNANKSMEARHSRRSISHQRLCLAFRYQLSTLLHQPTKPESMCLRNFPTWRNESRLIGKNQQGREGRKANSDKALQPSSTHASALIHSNSSDLFHPSAVRSLRLNWIFSS